MRVWLSEYASAQLTSIYQELIDALVEVGYEVRRDLFGAPYDWRLAADGLEQVRCSRALLQCRQASSLHGCAGSAGTQVMPVNGTAWHRRLCDAGSVLSSCLSFTLSTVKEA